MRLLKSKMTCAGVYSFSHFINRVDSNSLEMIVANAIGR